MGGAQCVCACGVSVLVVMFVGDGYGELNMCCVSASAVQP